RENEVASLKTTLTELAETEVTPSLRDAVRSISKWDDPDQELQEAKALQTERQEQLDQALALLGEPGLQLHALTSISWPSTATINALQNERQALLAQQATASQQLAQAQARVDELSLSLEQYKHTHHVVDPQAVIDARASRDRQ